ncbi:499_t:CDS:1, partial [Funneliformis mosseae]
KYITKKDPIKNSPLLLVVFTEILDVNHHLLRSIENGKRYFPFPKYIVGEKWRFYFDGLNQSKPASNGEYFIR